MTAPSVVPGRPIPPASRYGIAERDGRWWLTIEGRIHENCGHDTAAEASESVRMLEEDDEWMRRDIARMEAMQVEREARFADMERQLRDLGIELRPERAPVPAVELSRSSPDAAAVAPPSSVPSRDAGGAE